MGLFLGNSRHPHVEMVVQVRVTFVKLQELWKADALLSTFSEITASNFLFSADGSGTSPYRWYMVDLS